MQQSGSTTVGPMLASSCIERVDVKQSDVSAALYVLFSDHFCLLLSGHQRALCLFLQESSGGWKRMRPVGDFLWLGISSLTSLPFFDDVGWVAGSASGCNSLCHVLQRFSPSGEVEEKKWQRIITSLHFYHTMLCGICCRRVSIHLSVRPSVSVCPSVTSRYCVETTGRIELVFGMEASFHPSHSVVRKYGVSKN